MDRLVDHLFVFEGDGIIRDFPGNYSQYRMSLEDQTEEARNKEQETRNKKPATRNQQPATRRLSYKEKREFDLLEKEIADLNKEKEMIAQNSLKAIFLLGTPGSFTTNREVSTLLDAKEMRWLELSEVIDDNG